MRRSASSSAITERASSRLTLMASAMQPSQNQADGVRSMSATTSDRMLVAAATRGRAPPDRLSGASLRKESGRLGVVRGARQATVDDLVEERLVADLQDAGGLGAIPVHALQRLRDHHALRV